MRKNRKSGHRTAKSPPPQSAGRRNELHQGLSSWLSRSDLEWITRIPHPPIGKPDQILGEEDAAIEWEEGHSKQAVAVFTPIETYSEWTTPGALLLFGRRGTGKTALIRMVDYQVKRGGLPEYQISWVFDSEEIILHLATLIENSVVAQVDVLQLAKAITPIWFWQFMVSAMAAVVEDYRSRSESPADVEKCREFLDSVVEDERKNEAVRKAIWQHLLSCVKEVVESALSRDPIPEFLIGIEREFNSAAFQGAVAALTRVTMNRPCLVTTDSGDVYPIRDSTVNAVVTALINAVSDIRRDRGTTGLVVKAAFPSEIEPYLRHFNAGKIGGKTVTIMWRYRDLVSFLAKRYRQKLFPRSSKTELKSLDDLQAARRFLYHYLPPSITTRIGLDWDTLSYLVRHTQKTPREVLLLANTILTYAARHHTLDLYHIAKRPDVIVTGTHAALDSLVRDAINMYEHILPDVARIISRLLGQKRSVFDHREFSSFVKGVGTVPRRSLEREEIMGLAVRMGVVGFVHAAHRIESAQRWVLEVIFEYQVKQVLEPTEGAWFVVHPMFYEWLQSKVEAKTLTYPLAYEAEEQEALIAAGVVPFWKAT